MRITVLEHLYELLRSESLGDDDLEDVFREPVVGHHKPTLLPRPLTPRILHLVSDGLAGHWVNVHTAYDHRVRHGRLVNLEALLLGHAELDVESGLRGFRQDVSG